jgi:hypothetical protein
MENYETPPPARIFNEVRDKIAELFPKKKSMGNDFMSLLMRLDLAEQYELLDTLSEDAHYQILIRIT